MPLTSDRSSPSLSFGPSAVAELLFLLKSIAAGGELPRPVPPRLAERVRRLWGDEVLFWEVLVVAGEAGVLLEPLAAEELAVRLEKACRTVTLEPALRSEPEEDRRVIKGRLAALASDARLRQRWLRLLGEVWALFEPEWRSYLAAITAIAEECSRRAARGTAWESLLKGPETSPHIQQEGWERARLTGASVGLCAFGGSLVLDLPGGQFFAMTLSERPAAARERTEALARRLRAVADPTRLALLRLLALRPRTVGELASELAVSQPTVSNHIKVLRETSLVAPAGSGPERRKLAVDHGAVEDLVSELGAVLSEEVAAG